MDLKLLEDLWVEADTAGMDEPELLRYRSNLLGRDLRLTNFGGGNTSAKLSSTDPVTRCEVEVLWVKGSGGDLGTIQRDGFATLYLDRLNALRDRYRGEAFEDEVVDLYSHCIFGANPRAPSIDTPLHAYLPFAHVDHLHPDWAIALAAASNGPAHLDTIRGELGLRLMWLPWKRPGFELGLWLERAVKHDPEADGVILANHGLFTWGDSSRESYANTLRVIDGIGQYVTERIERFGDRIFGGSIMNERTDKDELVRSAMPVLRGEIGSVVGHFDDRSVIQRFINSEWGTELARQGTSCPDHFVRTKVRPFFVDWDPETGDAAGLLSSMREGMAVYRRDYESYYKEHKLRATPPMRSANPTVVLIPGVGMFSFGRNKTEARITGEFYINAIHVMEGATAVSEMSIDIDSGLVSGSISPNDDSSTHDVQQLSSIHNYVALPPREAFNIEYWQLEEAKLRRLPPESELSRKVAVVIGASPGIGVAVAERLARAGAHVAIADLNADSAESSAEGIRTRYGAEMAMTGMADCTDRASMREFMDSVVRQFGGIDILVQTAAVFFPTDPGGRITEDQWRKTLDVNLLGSMLAADEAQRVMTEQGSGGSIVLLSSANAVVLKKGSWAYEAGKAALNHLIRELAVELAPNIRVNGVAPASVVEGSTQFPRERVMSSLAKYGIEFDKSETTEELRERLAAFYAGRTLLKKKVTPADVAEAVFLLASSRLGATTGQIISVDAGLSDAFLR